MRAYVSGLVCACVHSRRADVHAFPMPASAAALYHRTAAKSLSAVVAEGGLAFLGLSVEKGPTWGKVILTGAGSRDLQKAPWIAIIPIIVLFLTVLSLNYAGDRIRSFFDVRETAL